MEFKKHLSQRGFLASEKPARVDLEIYNQAIESQYHPIENPQGKFPMNMAENHLCWQLLKEKIQKVTREKDIPNWVSSYGDPVGVLSFREAVAEFLSHFLIKKEIPADSIAISAGATSVIEMTSFLLAELGDTAVIPAPCYPVYTADIGMIPGVIRYDLQTHYGIAELSNGIPISIELLEKAKNDIEAQGSRFRMLILTTPDNPTGGIYAESQLNSLADWCIQQEIHLIVNEIYGLSRIDINHPEIKDDYPKAIPFVSFGKIMTERKNPFLHFWYSFSKDLGISGFRVGVLHTYNEDLIRGYRNAGLPHAISNHTQWILQEVLNDRPFMEYFVEESQRALTISYLIVAKKLENLGIPFNPSYGSLFIWMDMSEFLKEDSEKGQQELWLEIYEHTGILFTPADGFGHQKKGLFRVVISSLSHQALEVAIQRFEVFVFEKKKANRAY